MKQGGSLDSKVYVVTLTTEQMNTLKILCSRALTPEHRKLTPDEPERRQICNAQLALYRARG